MSVISVTEEYGIRSERLKRSLSIFKLFQSLGLSSLVRGGLREGITSQVSCVFHSPDVHPSARIYADTNRYWCFRCQTSLDVIGFYSLYKNVSKMRAVSDLEALAGLPALEISDSFLGELKDILESDCLDNNFGETLILSIEDRLLVLRNLLKLDQYIVILRYLDSVELHFKEFKSIDRKEFIGKLKEFLGKLDSIIREQRQDLLSEDYGEQEI